MADGHHQIDVHTQPHNPSRLVLQEAEADYAQVRALLEECGLPFEVTPGGEDCLEAFERVFGTQSYARVLTSNTNKTMDFSPFVGEESYTRPAVNETLPEIPMSFVEDPAAQAIKDFK